MKTRDVKGGKWRTVGRNLKIVCLLNKYEGRRFDERGSSFITIRLSARSSQTSARVLGQAPVTSYGHAGLKQAHPLIYVHLTLISVDMPAFPRI